MTAIVLSVAGGDFGTGSTWVGGVAPIAGDTVTCPAGSGPLNLAGSTARACATLDFTGYTNTLTLNGAMILTMTGNLTLASGMTIANSLSTVTFTSGATITAAGQTWPGKMILNSSGTFTLADNLTVTNLVTLQSSPVINGNILSAAGGLTVVAASNVTGTTHIKFTGTGTYTGGTGSIANNLTVDASGQTLTMAGTIFNYKTGTLTWVAGTVNWSQTLTLTGDCTINWTPTLPTFAVAGASTVTLGSALTITTFVLPNANLTFAGSFGWTVGTLSLPVTYASRTLSLVAGQEYKVTTALDNNNKNSNTIMTTVQSSTGGSKAIFTLDRGATQNLSWWNATDLDSSRGQAIFSYRGTITTTYNWLNSFPVPQNRPQIYLGA